MKSLRHFVSTISLLTFSLTSVGYGAERAPSIEFARPLGMGGAFTAVADDHNVFNYNPAGMVQRTGGQFTLFDLAGGMSEDSKDAFDFLDDNKDKLDSDFDDLPLDERTALISEIENEISKLDPRLYLAANVASYVSGPLPFHFGFGLFGVEDFTFKLENGPQWPNISFDSNADVVLPLALAYRWDAFGGKFGLGASAKFMKRYQAKQERINVLQLDTLDEPPVAEGSGIGADIGILYQPTDRTNIGLVLQDVGGTKLEFDAEPEKNGFDPIPEHSGIIKTRTNVGIAVVPERLLWLIPSGDRWTFAFDLKDIFKDDEHVLFENGIKNVFGENFGTHAYAGAEYRWWFLRFRGGAYQGYPSFGLGLDIPVLKLDYAFYGREIGYLAGDRRQDNHVISLALRFGSGHTEARERIAKKKEGRSQKNSAVPADEMLSTPSQDVPVTTTTPGASDASSHPEPEKSGNSEEQQIP